MLIIYFDFTFFVSLVSPTVSTNLISRLTLKTKNFTINVLQSTKNCIEVSQIINIIRGQKQNILVIKG